MMKYSHFETILVCDGWMERHTSCDSRIHAMHMHRAIKMSGRRALPFSSKHVGRCNILPVPRMY